MRGWVLCQQDLRHRQIGAVQGDGLVWSIWSPLDLRQDSLPLVQLLLPTPLLGTHTNVCSTGECDSEMRAEGFQKSGEKLFPG